MQGFFRLKNLAKKIASTSFIALSLFAMNARADAEHDLIKAKIKLRVEQFKPELVRAAPIDLSKLHVMPILPWEKNGMHSLGLEGMGIDGHVKFGNYRGKSVAIKFFKKQSFQSRNADTHLLKAEYEAKIKQGFFVMDSVHELGYAPAAYGYITEENLPELLRISGMRKNVEYYGAIVSERIRPRAHLKGRVQNVPNSIAADPLVEAQVKQAIAAINEVGLEIKDLDYMIDQEGKFRFFDFDHWVVHAKDRVWRDGFPAAPTHSEFCNINYEQLLRSLFK